MPPKTKAKRKTQTGGLDFTPQQKEALRQKGGMKRFMILANHQLNTPYANVQNGEGFFGDLWDGVKSVGSKAVNFVKDNKLISTGLALTGDPRAKVASGVASQLGFSKHRKRKNVLKF